MRRQKRSSARLAGVAISGLVIFCSFSLCTVSYSAPVQKRVYVAPDDHTDFMWKADTATYEQAMVEMLNYYLDQIDRSAHDPPQHQARWNCDGAYWLWAYQKHETTRNFDRLIERIRDGHISVPLNTLVSCYGAAPLEGIIRGMFPGGSFERSHNLRLSLAVAMENQTLPYGLGAIWAGCGAKYSWRGICGCATKVADASHRDNEVYWWLGPDGSRILMKWNSMLGANTGMGGYAEARQPVQAIDFVVNDLEFRTRYPYDVIGIFGKGWDDLLTKDDEIIRAAKTRSTDSRKVIVSNEEDFFVDFEKEYGNTLPAVAASYGNEWDTYCASLAETTAKVKRSVEKLRAAEAMAAYVALHDRRSYDALKIPREAAWMSLGLYWEHNWTADGPIARESRAHWQDELAGNIAKYSDQLFESSARGLSRMITKTSTQTQFFVFNPLSWPRTDYADIPWPGNDAVRVIDTGNGEEMRWQYINSDGRMVLRVLAPDVPALGYKVFEIQPSRDPKEYPQAAIKGNIFENDFYRLRINGDGSIASLIDKRQSNRQFAQKIRGRLVNDLGGKGGSIAVEDAGPVSTTVVARSDSPVKHETRVTLFQGIPRIEIKNDILENFGTIQTWSFSFALKNAETWHEEIGAIIRADLVDQGGHYASRNARYDWLTLNHFADMFDAEAGVVISNSDCCFMRLGNSTPSYLDTGTPQVSVLAGGQVDGPNFGIRNQGGCSRFTQRFALKTYAKREKIGFADSMKFSLEHQNPFVAQIIEGGSAFPAGKYSFLSIDDSNVVIWAIKPSEDAAPAGMVLRLWNLSHQTESPGFVFAPDSFGDISRVTHLENRPHVVKHRPGYLEEDMQPWEIGTYFLESRKPLGR